eukprot:scaffold39593_cov60-Phaeocystis_antarctica.AAC.2
MSWPMRDNHTRSTGVSSAERQAKYPRTPECSIASSFASRVSVSQPAPSPCASQRSFHALSPIDHAVCSRGS